MPWSDWKKFGGCKPTELWNKSPLRENVHTYKNNSDKDIRCIFSIFNFRGSVSDDTLTLSGCTTNQTFHNIQGGLCIGCFDVTIPANGTFACTTKYISDQDKFSALSLIQVG